MADEPRTRAVSPRFQSVADERVLQHLVVLLDGSGGEAGVAPDRRVVDEATVLGGHHVQEAREAPEVAHQRLGLDLLAKVRLGITREHFAGFGLAADCGRRQAAVAEGALELETLPQLLARQRVEAARRNPACEQVGAAAAQLASARASEQEAHPAMRFDQPMHLVQQRRDALHLVDEHGPNSSPDARLDLGSKQRRLLGVAQKRVLPQQIDGEQGSWQQAPDERALACLSRAQQEARAAPRQPQKAL